MANSTVSIYIDDTSIRLMVTRGKRITKLAEAPLEMSLSDVNTEEKETELANKIKNLLKLNKVNDKKIILGLSGLHCLTRPLVLPELPKAMLGEAVIREAKRLLPMPMEQLYISWQVVSYSEGKVHIFLVALPRQIADMVVRVINQAGCKPYLMDIKPLAMARLSREANAIIVDVQSKEFDIVIMTDGIPQPIRTIAFPEESRTLEERFNIIKEDLKRTIEFYNSKITENQIEPETIVLISGELAGEPELYESLAKELGFKVALLTSPLKSLKNLDPSRYMVNVGLALKELVKEAGPLLPNFNTLPAPYQPRHISMNKLMAVPVAIAAAVVIVLLATTIQNAAANIESVQNQLDNANFRLEKKQAQKKEMADSVKTLEQQIANAEAEYSIYVVALKTLANTGNNMNTDLEATVDNVVDDLLLKTISHGGGQVNISGTADSEQEVFEYVRNLTATGRFSEITIASIRGVSESQDAESTTVEYSLKCTLEGSEK